VRRRNGRARKAQNERKSKKGFIRALKVSCRIDRVVGADEIAVLCISGRITRQEVDTLRNLMEAESSAVAIDLKHVDLIDRDTVRFLAQRELNGTVLRNCSAYIREWVTREQTEMMETSGDIENA
jgi:hypothetical protein